MLGSRACDRRPSPRCNGRECRMRVLLIEDEARISELVARALERAGFVIEAFATCADAREALSLIRYDAAILDLGLPDGDGLALLAAMRASGNRLPILVLTARDA